MALEVSTPDMAGQFVQYAEPDMGEGRAVAPPYSTLMNCPNARNIDAVIDFGAARHDSPDHIHLYEVMSSDNQAMVERILYETVSTVRDQMEPDGRLYVVIGENHGSHAHNLAQASLLDDLANEGNRTEQQDHGAAPHILYAIELPQNVLSHTTRKHYEPLNEAQAAALDALDDQGHLYAQMAITKNTLPYARGSLGRTFDLCMRKHIPLAYVDVHYVPESGKALPASDPLAQEVATSLFDGLDLGQVSIPKTPKTEADGSSDERGMIIRNAVMAQRITEAAQRHDADVTVIKTGMRHVTERLQGREMDTSRSLCAFLQDQIRPQDKILPVFLLPRSYVWGDPAEIIPEHLRQNGQDVLVIKGINEGSVQHVNPEREELLIKQLEASYRGSVPDYYKAPAGYNEEDMRAALQSALNTLDAG